jgi:hypothetical protein
LPWCAAGVHAAQSIDATARLFDAPLIWLMIALGFVNPTHIVARAAAPGKALAVDERLRPVLLEECSSEQFRLAK